MRRRAPLSAADMALTSAFGAGIVLIVFLLIGIFHARFHALCRLERVLLILPGTVLGMAISISAQRGLRRGVREGRWPPAEVKALRTTMDSGLWSAAGYGCLILYCVLLIQVPRYMGLALAFMVVSQIITAIRSAVPRNQDPAPNLLGDWQSTQRLESQHWGER